ncbi:MAG: hypothetical protein M1143_00870 [Candidatus Thermoplasmatota archaeon]|nr:hypothetical protein [Candidatus Thermoplasmatota archaeon]
MSLFKKRSEENPVFVETVRPVEIPVITAVKQCLAKNNYGEAVRYGYQAAIYDFQRAYKVVFSTTLSNKDILDRELKNAGGYLPQLFEQFYLLYEPVRYGKPGGWRGHEGDVVGILQSIYSMEPLWRLYAQQVSNSTGGGSSGRAVKTRSGVRLKDSHIYVSRTNAERPPMPGEKRLPNSQIYVRTEEAYQRNP